MIPTVVVGYGLAGRAFHCPLIARQKGLTLYGVVARDPAVRAEAVARWDIRGYESVEDALIDPVVRLVVIATPHDSHAELAVRALEAGKDCVVDKVMALNCAEADRMIAARDRSRRMLSVFHNRRWDWDFLTLNRVLDEGLIGRPLIIESSVCRHAAPRSWRGRYQTAGTILHDWGAHQIDQALGLGLGPCRRLTAWITPAPWPDVDSGGHGRVVLEFDDILFQVETSRICSLDRPRFWIVGSAGCLVKHGLDPQEDALRAGCLEDAREAPDHQALIRKQTAEGAGETVVETVRGSWDSYYANIVEHLNGGSPLAVTAEEGREVVRILDAAIRSVSEHATIEGPWGRS